MSKTQNVTTDVAQAATNVAREALYVTVGLGVLGFQRAQVQRVELQRKLAGHPVLETGLAGARQALSTGHERLEGFVGEATRAAETTVGPLGEQLPKAAREVAQRAQDGAQKLAGQVQQLINRS